MTDAEMPPEQLQRLVTLNRALMHQHLLRGLAHDVRNNLQVVALGASLGGEQASATIVHQVEKSLEGIVATLDLLSGLGRPRVAEPAGAELPGTVEEALKLATLQRNFPILGVTLAGPIPPATVAMPRADLILVLLNLLANAKTAAGAAADPVTVSASPPVAGRVTVEVHDRGPGMPATAGSPFVSTGDPAVHGGLGLVVSRALVERTGGTLGWERLPGGTVVRITIPATAGA